MKSKISKKKARPSRTIGLLQLNEESNYFLTFALAALAAVLAVVLAADFIELAAFAIELAAVLAAFDIAFAAFAIALAAFAIVFAAVFAALAALLAAVFVFAASPQAIPKAPITRTADSAITFFIMKVSPVSSSKIRSNLLTEDRASTVLVPNLSILGTFDNIMMLEPQVNPEIVICELFFGEYFAKSDVS